MKMIHVLTKESWIKNCTLAVFSFQRLDSPIFVVYANREVSDQPARTDQCFPACESSKIVFSRRNSLNFLHFYIPERVLFFNTCRSVVMS